MSITPRAFGRARNRRLAAIGVFAAGALLLAACGDDGDDMSGMDHGGGKKSSSAPEEAGGNAGKRTGEFNDADVTFAQSMIPHHEQALEMAKLADGRAESQQIKDLAGQIEKAQDPEIKTMTGWLKSWGKPTKMEGGEHGMDHGMSGMISDADMKKLENSKGAAFDKAFAEMMIEHHKGAIEMAKTERKDGRNAAAKKLAGAVITGQSAEVKKFQQFLDEA
ncbi:DUF305 domain-containing protein [Streptomyces boninensis]|uniref:DUF305 domain-containing protein n=1 Tax=Streptomyces boninensis TaxID=2039455 RepID=UPI003B21AF43